MNISHGEPSDRNDERITPGGLPQDDELPNIDRAYPSDLADEPTEPPFPGT